MQMADFLKTNMPWIRHQFEALNDVCACRIQEMRVDASLFVYMPIKRAIMVEFQLVFITLVFFINEQYLRECGVGCELRRCMPRRCVRRRLLEDVCVE